MLLVVHFVQIYEMPVLREEPPQIGVAHGEVVEAVHLEPLRFQNFLRFLLDVRILFFTLLNAVLNFQEFRVWHIVGDFRLRF